MKPILLGLALFISGCSDMDHKTNLKLAECVCKNKGGISYYYKSFGSHYIDCKNGMHVSITDNEDCK